MYANSLKYLFRKFINWERKGNFNYLFVHSPLYYAYASSCKKHDVRSSFTHFKRERGTYALHKTRLNENFGIIMLHIPLLKTNDITTHQPLCVCLLCDTAYI